MRLQKQRGSVLMGVMALFLALSILSLTVVHAMGAETRSTANRTASAQALALADAGVDYVYTRLKQARIRPQNVESDFDYPSEIDDWNAIRGRTILEVTWPGGNTITVSSTGIVEQPPARRRVIQELNWKPHPALQYALAAFGDGSLVHIGGNVELTGHVHSNGTAEAVWVEGHPPEIEGVASYVGEINDPHGHFEDAEQVEAIDAPTEEEIAEWIEAAKEADAWEEYSEGLRIAGSEAREYKGIVEVHSGAVQDGLEFSGGATVTGDALFIVWSGDILIKGASVVEASFLLMGDGEIKIEGTGPSGETMKMAGTVASERGTVEFKGNVSMEQRPLCDSEHEAVYGWERGTWREGGAGGN